MPPHSAKAVRAGISCALAEAMDDGHCGLPGIKLDKVEIGIDGDIDLRGFFGIDDRIRAGFNAVRIHVSLSGPEHATRYEELAAAVDAHCPVLDLFRNPVPVERKLVSTA
jgi:hypothetical protein